MVGFSGIPDYFGYIGKELSDRPALKILEVWLGNMLEMLLVRLSLSMVECLKMHGCRKLDRTPDARIVFLTF